MTSHAPQQQKAGGAEAASPNGYAEHRGSAVIARGAYIAKIGGCNDCHTPGYAEHNGKASRDVLLIGVPVGFQGPWGTTYAVNLRLLASTMTEAQWVKHLSTFATKPPMPWYDVRLLPSSDKRALYRYIKSLGAPGKPTPPDLPPGQAPKTPYIVYAPPTMPASH
jgi:hypothetical protein